jgi:hypothetical protein
MTRRPRWIITVLAIAILGAVAGLVSTRSRDATPEDFEKVFADVDSIPPLTDAELDAGEIQLARTTGIPEAFLRTAKGAGSTLRRLQGMDEEGTPVDANGITIDVPFKSASATARELQEGAPAGVFVFVSKHNFGLGARLDSVSALRAASQFEALQVMGTNAWNYDFGPDRIIQRMKGWHERFGLVIRGVGFDWVEAEFVRQPTDMQAFASEVYEFCPDVVTQGTNTVDALAKEMQRTNTVYLWWD